MFDKEPVTSIAELELTDRRARTVGRVATLAPSKAQEENGERHRIRHCPDSC